MQQEQEQQPEPQPEPQQEQQEQQEATEQTQQAVDQMQESADKPTKDVGTFWNRLDVVFDKLIKGEEGPVNPVVQDVIDQFPSEDAFVERNVRSVLFQPDRVSIKSSDSVVPPPNPFTFSDFTIRLVKPVLNVKQVQLLRSYIPTPIPSFPDTELTFFYYRFPVEPTFTNPSQLTSTYQYPSTAVTNAQWNGGSDNHVNLDVPSGTAGYTVGQYITLSGFSIAAYNGTFRIYNASGYVITVEDDAAIGKGPAGPGVIEGTIVPTLFFVRLLPSYLPPELVNNPGDYGFNRSFTDYDDLVTELNRCAASDVDSYIFPQTYNGVTLSYDANDISFYYSLRFNKIAAEFNTAGNYYFIAPPNDPNLSNAYQILQRIWYSQPPAGLVSDSYVGTNPYGSPSPYGTPSTFKFTYPLAFRLGFSYTGQPANEVYNFAQQWRPTINPAASSGSVMAIYGNTYANLVNTAGIYLYVDFVQGSGEDSAGNANLLSVIPINTANNSVGFYDKVTENTLKKIPSQIQSITVSMRDEIGNPFNLPNSAIVNFELGFSY